MKIKGTEILYQMSVDIGKPIEWALAKVDVKQIKFNKRNPNVMDEKMYGGVSKNIDNMGFSEFPVLFYDKKFKELLCIDGEHRIIAVKEKGHKHVYVGIILEGISRSQAYSGAFSFNKFKGQIDGLKLAQMVQYGLQEWGEKDVMKYFQLQKYQIDEQLMHLQNSKDTSNNDRNRTSNFQKVNADVIRHNQNEMQSIPITDMDMTFMLTIPRRKYDFIIETLQKVDKENNVKSLYEVCKFYREHRKK